MASTAESETTSDPVTQAAAYVGDIPHQASYDLLCEEDPEEFESVEVPSDLGETHLPPVYPQGKRRSREFRLLGRRRDPDRVKKMIASTLPQDISQLNTEDEQFGGQVRNERIPEGEMIQLEETYPPPEATTFPLSRPPSNASGVDRSSSEPSTQSSTYSVSGSSGSGTGSARVIGRQESTSLRSDMLISLNNNSGPVEMSVRQSLHIGVAAADLNLPSDEEIAKEATRSRLSSVNSDHREREFEDEDVESVSWSRHSKHVFILSTSGKPVYSRYGKEEKLVNLFGIMQALVSFVQDDRDHLKTIVAGDHKFVFVCRGPLVFVAVVKTRQSETQIALQLMYAYNQVLSVLTNTQLQQIFEKNAGFDLRYLLQGSEKFVDNILSMADSDPSFIFNGVQCLPMPVGLRQTITATLKECRTKDVLFALLVAKNQLITFITPREHHLVPMDIHLIINLVDASTSFRSAESWTPICLPKFNDTGFLHAHVSFLPSNSPACLLLISTDKEKFFALQECQQKIVERLERQGCIEEIKKAARDYSPYSIGQLQLPSELRHFVYKSRKTLCVTSPQQPVIYSEREDKERLFEQYMLMHQKLHYQHQPIKILYHVGEREALLGWRTAGFDLYTVFDPLIAKSQAILLGNKLIRWISKEEERLIITSSQTF